MVDIGSTASESGDSITTRDRFGSAVICCYPFVYTKSSPRQIPPPILVPVVIENPMPTPFSANIYIDLYPSSIPSAPVRLMSIPSFHVGTFQFPDTPKANHLSNFQFPVQYAIENSYSQFSVSLLNIGATPDIDPEPRPWIAFLCMVSVILVRFRISLWGSNDMSALFLEISFTHELVRNSCASLRSLFDHIDEHA